MSPIMQSGSAQIHYNLYTCMNEKSDKFIILIHGLGMDSRYWYKVIPLLRENFNVITFDLRGHGESTTGAEEISWATLNEDLIHLLRDLKLTQVHLLGHGLGANFAIQFSYHYPSYIQSLTIISTIIYFAPKVSSQVLSYRKQLTELDSLKLLADYLVPKILRDSSNSVDTELLYSCYSKIRSTTYFTYFETLVGDTLSLDQISEIHIPTLILTGEYDPIFPPKVTGLSAFTFPNNHYAIISNSANIPFLDEPSSTIKRVTNFIVGDVLKTKRNDVISDGYLEELGTHIHQIIQNGAAKIEPPRLLQVTLTNSFTVRYNGAEIHSGWNQRMAKSLLCYLLFHRSVIREQVCDDLMSEVHLDHAKRNLRVYLHHLKRLINRDQAEFLKTDHEHIYLTGQIECDLVRYMKEINNLENKDVAEHYEAYVRVLKNAPRSILPGIFDEWALKLRIEVQNQIIQLAERVSLYHKDRCQYLKAAEYLESVADFDCVEDQLIKDLLKLLELAQVPNKLKYWKKRYDQEVSSSKNS